MKTKKKTAKAVTLLTKIETLLSAVLEECSEIERSVEKNAGVLLRSAEASIAAAKEYFIASTARGKTVKAARRAPRHRVARARSKAPVAAKRRAGGSGARKVA